MNFSGRTSTLAHKQGDAWKKSPGAGEECLSTVRLLNVQWTNCPVEVEDQVRNIWRREELGNDNSYYRTSLSDIDQCIEYDSEDEPIHPVNWQLLKDFLISKGVTDPKEEILIHWWW